MRHIIRKILLSLFVVIIGGATVSATNMFSYWSVTPSSCNYDPAFTAPTYSGGSAGCGASNTCVLYCPLGTTASVASATHNLNATRKGLTSGTSYFTKIELIAQTKGSNTESVVNTLNGSSNSNIVEDSVGPLGGFDFTNFRYYVKITMKSGTLAGQAQTVYGLGMD